MRPTNTATRKGVTRERTATSGRDVALSCPYRRRFVVDFDADRMPLAVAKPRTRVSNRVLSAQLVGDAGRCAIQVLQIVDDLRPAAGVVGDPSQRIGVDAIVSAGGR